MDHALTDFLLYICAPIDMIITLNAAIRGSWRTAILGLVSGLLCLTVAALNGQQLHDAALAAPDAAYAAGHALRAALTTAAANLARWSPVIVAGLLANAVMVRLIRTSSRTLHITLTKD